MDDEKTRQREINGLLEALVPHDLKEGLIITDDEEETLNVEGKKIRVLPCWKWVPGYNGEDD